MNTNRRSTSGRRRISLAAALLVFLLASSPLSAQTSSIPDRLPADTIFYLHWHGKVLLGGAEEKNQLLRLLTDPDFAPLRDALVKASQGDAGKDKTAPALDFAEILSLLENAATFGVVVHPAPPKTDPAGSAAPFVGAFAVYDTTGKTALIEKMKALMRAKAKEAPVVTIYEFGGTTVDVRTTGPESSYTAQTGKYYLFSDQKELIEDLIARFRGTEKPASSVTQLPEYQAIRSFMGPDSTVEIFARMPDLNKLIPADKQATPGVRATKNLHLEKLHAIGSGVSFAGEATRLRGAILGDTSPPSLFDIAGASGPTFVTLPVVNPGPLFGISRYDLPATYRLIRTAAMEALPPQQSAGITMGEGMAQGYLGMSVDDALHLLTGEIASQAVYSEDGSSSQVYAVAIQKPQEVLRVLRATIGKLIVAEDTEGETAFLDVSYPIHDAASGQDKRIFYYVAVTPQVLFTAPRKAMVREAMVRLNAKSGATSPADISTNANLNRMRALLPEKLSGLGAADLAHFPWDKIFAQIAQQINEDAKGSKEPTPQSTDLLKLIKPEAFSRHLHAVISGWWKDSNGLYFDAYLQ